MNKNHFKVNEASFLKFLTNILEEKSRPFYTKTWFTIVSWFALVACFTTLFKMNNQGDSIYPAIAIILAFLLGIVCGLLFLWRLSFIYWSAARTYVNKDLVKTRLNQISETNTQ